MIQKLIEGIIKKDAPVVVGLDPNLSFIPGFILTEAEAAAEGDIPPYCEKENVIAAEAVFQFNKKITDAVYDLVPAVKPQVAMYEQFGIPGMIAYRKTVEYCRSKGLIVIGDVKRGDIGSTSEAYARGHLAGTAFDVDFATVNPYLGSDGVKPFIKICKEHDKGIFVLVKTSNPSSGEFQDVLTGDGRAVYELVGSKVNEWGADCMEGVYSNVGAVVGATYPEQARILRKLMPHTFILAPGYGAQGATAKDLSGFFDADGLGAIVNSSRGIIAAYKKDAYAKYGEEGFADAARAAAVDMIEDLRGAIHGGRTVWNISR
ncbi:MAG: orotidine-5'-phosphate decarboxylase [Lachnospiraceae bacterium]|nr:orotidine-5'-phosphate decarboxylase [Lachnospiraceae bacterium]